jgi:hypothetical protein
LFILRLSGKGFFVLEAALVKVIARPVPALLVRGAPLKIRGNRQEGLSSESCRLNSPPRAAENT